MQRSFAVYSRSSRRRCIGRCTYLSREERDEVRRVLNPSWKGWGRFLPEISTIFENVRNLAIKVWQRKRYKSREPSLLVFPIFLWHFPDIFWAITFWLKIWENECTCFRLRNVCDAYVGFISPYFIFPHFVLLLRRASFLLRKRNTWASNFCVTYVIAMYVINWVKHYFCGKYACSFAFDDISSTHMYERLFISHENICKNDSLFLYSTTRETKS